MAIDALINWISKRPNWQQDALRRIATSIDLSDADSSQILANLKISKGLQQKVEAHVQPLTKDSIQPDAAIAPLVRLCSIGNVKNANQLAPDQLLPFAIDGLTLIYGDNGSGKSGYCRIAKKFCRAIVKDTILPDVFSTGTPAPAEACIRYKLENSEHVNEVTWRDGEEAPNEVAHLSVFDSHNARLYVDERNRIDYVPYEIELLTRFGQLLTRLHDKLSAEIEVVDNRLNVDLPTGYTPDTAVSKLVERLTIQTPLAQLPTVAEINSLGTWTNDLAHELETLQQAVGNDPKVLAARCRRVQKAVSSLVGELKNARNALSETKALELKEAVDYAQSTATAASLAATMLFENEPLPRVGSTPWQLMFHHAKEYSKLVYPEIEPPATGEGDLCVLCQQPLAGSAAERLRRFEDYVAGEAKINAEKAATNRDHKSSSIKAIQLRSPDDARTLLGEFSDLSESRNQIATAVVRFIEAAHFRRERLLSAVEPSDFSEAAPLDDAIIDQLVVEVQALEDEASALDKAAGNNAEREKNKEKLINLRDRKRFFENLETIRARRNDLESRARLQKCVNASKTNAVSHQVSVLRRELVTEDLKNRIRTEIDKFDLNHIPLLVNDVSKRGESEFDLKLDAKIKVASRDVLSEGEQRALGLACFLADVNGQPVKHGIIVDDPVSSLDLARLRRVAARLVEEAALGRQVIVFTHNLLFFAEVISVAAAHSPVPVPILTNVVRKAADRGFGVVQNDDQPWEAKPTTKRINLLREKVMAIEIMTDKDGEDYRQKVKSFYTDLRETWERFVEEVLLYRVVERFGSDVKTQSLKRVVVTDEDYKTIFWGMKRASEHSGHDMAAGKNMPVPNIEDMKEEVNALDRYRDKVGKRAKATEEVRKKLEQAPKAITA